MASDSLAQFSVNAVRAARHAVYDPERYYQAEAYPRPYEPHRPSSVNQKSAHGQMCRIAPEQAIPKSEVMSQEEHIDNSRDDRNPDAPPFPEDESFPKVEDAPNPEKLTGKERQEAKG
jgi:hypothetical protein